MSVTLTNEQLQEFADKYYQIEEIYIRQTKEIQNRSTAKGRNELPLMFNEIRTMEWVMRTLNLNSEIKNLKK